MHAPYSCRECCRHLQRLFLTTAHSSRQKVPSLTGELLRELVHYTSGFVQITLTEPEQLWLFSCNFAITHGAAIRIREYDATDFRLLFRQAQTPQPFYFRRAMHGVSWLHYQYYECASRSAILRDVPLHRRFLWRFPGRCCVVRK